jgi:lysophospholipase L1-like esterase
MKRMIVAVICVLCLAVIIFGKVYWNHKIESTSAEARYELQNNQQAGADQDSETNTKSNNEQNGEQDTEESTPETDLEQLTSKLPSDLAEKITKAVEAKETLTLAAVGSNATKGGEGNWPSLLQQQLNEAYGKGVFNVSVKSYGDALSTEVWQQTDEMVELQPDIILLEPFTLNDNGDVAVEDSLTSIDLIRDAIQTKLQEVTFILQPPNPIHQPDYYLDQVEALQQYAEENNILYLNHWENWPDPQSGEITNYIQEDQSLPNDKGNEVWAEYVAEFLTGK